MMTEFSLYKVWNDCSDQIYRFECVIFGRWFCINTLLILQYRWKMYFPIFGKLHLKLYLSTIHLLTNFQATAENSSLSSPFDFIRKMYNNKKPLLSLSLIPRLACTNLNNVWDFVLQALPVFIWLFMTNRLLYSFELKGAFDKSIC